MAPLPSFDKAMKAPPETMKTSMDEWNAWMKKHEKSMVDSGAPLGKVMRVNKNGTSNIRNMIGGYSIVEAESLEAAAKIFEGSPHLSMMDDGWIEVIECVPMPGV